MEPSKFNQFVSVTFLVVFLSLRAVHAEIPQKNSNSTDSAISNNASSKASLSALNSSSTSILSTRSNESKLLSNSPNGPQRQTITITHDIQKSPPAPSSSSSTTQKPSEPNVLPEKGSAEQEHHSSMAIFFVLCVLVYNLTMGCLSNVSRQGFLICSIPIPGLCILFIHLMIQTQLQYLPESIVVIFLGGLVGFGLKLMSDSNSIFGNWQKEEALSPTAFFLVLLPPIIFESGYNLHKGNFFQNIGSICVFAILGTVINAIVIGSGVYLLGLADIVYRLDFVQSFAFGSLISAVDPVATLAIFNAIDVDPILNMLVFGESILNDAVAIVLTATVLGLNGGPSTSSTVLQGISNFSFMFLASAAIGVSFALASALLLKHIDLRKNPSLEFGMMLIFTYGPYTMAEGIKLSGIMAILFCGIVMSHYTHFNLSPVTQITMQQTMRTLSFIAETCVFAYLGLAIFSFHHRVEISLVVWSLFLCLAGRALNIFPLGKLVNRFRSHQITNKMLFVMWFSGLRGAIAYALSLHLEFEKETRQVIITTTLIIILFTTLVLGGLTMPIVKCVQAESRSERSRRRRRRTRKEISLSKTKEMGQTIDSELLSELTEEELDQNNIKKHNAFVRFDMKYLQPFFTRRFTQQELKDCQSQMTDLTNRWYQNVRVSPVNSEDEEIVEFNNVSETCAIIHNAQKNSTSNGHLTP